MGIIAWIKKALAPITKDDPLFGLLKYERAGWWEAHPHFAPLGETVYCSIDGGEEAPTEMQRKFYGEIEMQWPALLEKVRPLLQEEAKHWLEREMKPNPFDDFNFPAIDIPAIESSNIDTLEWQLAFEFDKPDERWFYVRILMRGWEPTDTATDT